MSTLRIDSLDPFTGPDEAQVVEIATRVWRRLIRRCAIPSQLWRRSLARHRDGAVTCRGVVRRGIAMVHFT